MEPIEVREFRSRIGKAIRRLREDEGISAQFFAKVLGVTQPTISRIENGTTSIAAEKLCFIAQSFNRPLSFFIGVQSSIIYDEEDILRAGLVYYGAKHLRSKRTINVREYYRTYADFLNAALSEVDDSRFAAALATTLYHQAAQNRLRQTKIISTIQHKSLLINLKALLKIINDARFNIIRPSNEKEKALRELMELCEGLGEDINFTKATVAEISPYYVARFINASIGNE